MILIMNLQSHNTSYIPYNFSFVYLNLSYKQSLMKFLDLSFLQSSASLNKIHTEPWFWKWIFSVITLITPHTISLSFATLIYPIINLMRFLVLSPLKSFAIGTLSYKLVRFWTLVSCSQKHVLNWSNFNARVSVFTMRWYANQPSSPLQVKYSNIWWLRSASLSSMLRKILHRTCLNLRVIVRMSSIFRWWTG
jgi:hypothetical protein